MKLDVVEHRTHQAQQGTDCTVDLLARQPVMTFAGNEDYGDRNATVAKVRFRIHHDWGYPFQSYAVAERWDGDRWQEVATAHYDEWAKMTLDRNRDSSVKTPNREQASEDCIDKAVQLLVTRVVRVLS